VVDHVTPHKGDWTEFVTGDLQSLCEPCHNSAKRQIELRGYRCDVGVDGYPTDPNHPFNRAGPCRAFGSCSSQPHCNSKVLNCDRLSSS
jgi:hypothetical protein